MQMQVCGRGDGVLGDGIVPVEAALLEGAEQVVLDGVFHSMSQLGTFDTSSGAHLQISALWSHCFRTAEHV